MAEGQTHPLQILKATQKVGALVGYSKTIFLADSYLAAPIAIHALAVREMFDVLGTASCGEEDASIILA